MPSRDLFAVCVLAAMGCANAPPPKPPVLRTTSTHPMQYYVSLPPNWSKDREWPVVITFAGSGKDWVANATSFATERDRRKYPFILVTPVSLTNGGTRNRSPVGYDYDSTTWDRIERDGRCQFDMDGLRAIIADVAREFRGQPKAFMTGFSGGGQVAIAVAYLYPDSLRAVAIAASNYSGRCITEATEVPGDKLAPQTISQSPTRATLPIRYYNGSEDRAGSFLIPQRDRAIAVGREHGFNAISAEIVKGAGHEAMTKNVLRFFGDMLSPNER